MIPPVDGSMVPARSITDVANASGVSIATVSRALRGLPNVSERTRAIVRQAAEDLGYVASSSASGLASGRTMAMGVIVPSLDPWFCTRALEGVDDVLRPADYDLVLFTLGHRRDERERLFRHTLLRRRIDALIALCIDVSASERELLTGMGHPIVCVGGRAPGLRHVDIDQADAARVATKHLIDLGHTRIAHLAGTIAPGLTEDAIGLRRRGYERALHDAHLAPLDQSTIPAALDMAGAHRIVVAILRRQDDRPTAVFADSDDLAAGAVLAARTVGLRVPDELSVIGFGDQHLAEAFDLTTVAVDPYEQGAAAAHTLLHEVKTGTQRAKSIRMPVRLVERGSTAHASPR
ncbi:LacI family DNA-binding transcriptional regulator [Humibacter sp. RRB41]|uniref:LacI family DNA-binding transcriptional regulator n=1 Tax=Humibacter sp. RRB41 TaxID=2919946 RepID=UPI001FAA48B6|nr:LacI family DNA-binding transcriptional regulator [Humibacter sp. RRB41]